MRSISSESLALLAGKLGIESVNIVAVDWAGVIHYYADKQIPGLTSGVITEISAFDSTTRIDGGGQSSSCSIIISDIAGIIKEIFNNTDIHKRPVIIYQWFAGLPLSEKFPILSGVIHSPIIWNEKDRTLKFDVLSRIEDYEVGFDASEGTFPTVSQRLIGTPWPMCFGRVIHAPALQLQDIPTGFTLTPFGVHDHAIDTEVAKLGQKMAGLRVAAGQALLYAALACYGGGEVDGGDPGEQSSDCNDFPDVIAWNEQSKAWQEEANDIQLQIIHLSAVEGSQSMWERATLVETTVPVTIPFRGKLRVGNQLFRGFLDKDGGRINPTPVILNTFQGIEVDEQGQPVRDDNGFPVLKPTAIEKAGFQFFNAGSQVTIADNYPIQWMVSIVPGTIEAVWAYRSFNGLKKLTIVPPKYYTTNTLDFGPIQAQCVTMKIPLSVVTFLESEKIQAYENNFGDNLPPHLVTSIDWEDQIYVTFVSDIGPNPIDIMEYLIDNYAPGLTYDATSFDHVRSRLESYGMNFLLDSRPHIIELLQQLAYQCRCAIWIDQDKFYIKYLPEEVDAVDTITLDDIVVASLEITSTPSENLVTKYTATYRPDYSSDYNGPVTLILRHNVKKYGTHAEDHEFFAYNNYFQVEKSATFWMIRNSNTFKIVRCKLTLNKLNLETFDTVNLNFGSTRYLANGTVKGIVQSAVYNSADNTIDVEIWTPVRLGEMEPFELAWPADIDEKVIWPVRRDITAGNAGGLNGHVTGALPPANNIQIIFDQKSKKKDRGREDVTRRPDSDTTYTDLGIDPPPLIPIDFGDPNPSDNNDIDTRNIDKPTTSADSIDPPQFDYEFGGFEDDRVNTINGAQIAKAYPCRIDSYQSIDPVSKKQYYKGTIYPKGTNKQGRGIDKIIQLDIDKDDRIPPGTWGIISMTIWAERKNEDGTSASATKGKAPKSSDAKDPANYNFIRQASIQIPIWIT